MVSGGDHHREPHRFWGDRAADLDGLGAAGSGVTIQRQGSVIWIHGDALSPSRRRTPGQTPTSRRSCMRSRRSLSCQRSALLAIRFRSLATRATTSMVITSSLSRVTGTSTKAAGSKPSALALSTRSTPTRCRTFWCARLTGTSGLVLPMAQRRAALVIQSWGQRTCGDYETAPDPSFIGQTDQRRLHLQEPAWVPG